MYKTASRANKRAADWASSVAEGSEHVADLLPVPKRPADWQQIPRCPPSSITGYTGVRLRGQRYRALCGSSYLDSYQTAEEAAEVYGQAAIERNIAVGYDKHAQAKLQQGKDKEAKSTRNDQHTGPGPALQRRNQRGLA